MRWSTTVAELSISGEPQRRGEIGEDAHAEMQAAHPVQAGDAEQSRMRQVALQRAAVAHRVVEHVGRQLLVAAAQLGQEPAIQPPRRRKAASTKSWLMISPPSGGRPESTGSRQHAAKAATRRMALWPSSSLRRSARSSRRATARHRSCATRLQSAGEQVSRPAGTMWVWTRPVR